MTRTTPSNQPSAELSVVYSQYELPTGETLGLLHTFTDNLALALAIKGWQTLHGKNLHAIDEKADSLADYINSKGLHYAIAMPARKQLEELPDPDTYCYEKAKELYKLIMNQS